MYVCIYACMYVCIYACMLHVCIYVCMLHVCACSRRRMMKEERAQKYTGCQPKRKEDKKTRNILKLLDPDAVIKCHRNERTHPHSYTYIQYDKYS